MSDVELLEIRDMEADAEVAETNLDSEENNEVSKSKTPSRGASPLMVFENGPVISPSPPPGEGGTKTLHQLARDGDADTIKLWLDSGPLDHINDLDEKRLAPLHYAARHSNMEVMKVLVEHGADVNKLGDDNMTPLHYAARYGRSIIPREKRKTSTYTSPLLTPTIRLPSAVVQDEGDNDLSTLVKEVKENVVEIDDVVDYLIENGALINAQDRYGMTPLHHTAIRGNKLAMKRLLNSAGIIKEPRDAQSSTPLHLAATYNQPEIALMLLKDGDANPTATDGDQRTPLHEACQEGNVSVAKILLENGKQDPKSMTKIVDDDGSTPLLLGVGKGGTSIVELLLKHGANPNQRSKENVFPVHSAARTGDLDTLKLLVQKRAIINCLNSMHQTPLYLAAESNNLEVIEFLLEKGANIDTWSMNNITPVMIAAIEGHADAVKLLIENGARLDICDKDDRSVLFHAARENSQEVLNVLLDSSEGVDLLHVADLYDNLPIHIAAKEGHLESVKILLDNQSPIDQKNEDEQTPIHLASSYGRIDVVKELLDRDQNLIMSEDEDSNTPLHLACMNRKFKTAELLLREGAEVQSRNAKKWTPLDCAASVGAVNCARLLLETNAIIDPLDRTKTTPLHLAAENGHSKMIDLLLANGADITMEDSSSRNPLERAIISGKKKCVTTILEHKDWKKAMRTSHLTKDYLGTTVPETPLRLLIKTYPDLAEIVFNKCITRETTTHDENGDPITPKKTVHMNYEFIDDAFLMKAPQKEGEFFKYCNVTENDECVMFKKAYNSNAKVVMDNHPLMIMAEQGQRNLLRHPLCLALVRKKWMNYGRHLYYTSLFFYLVFLFFLTSYALLTPNVQSLDTKLCTAKGFREVNDKTFYLLISQIGIIIISSFNCFFELIQFFRTGHRYIQWTNLFDWIVYIMAILLVLDVQENASVTGERTCWQWELIAVNVTLAWLNLLGEVRQLPFLGIYVIMFFDILKTFMRFAIVFGIFIVAFGLGFHLLLINQTPFQSVESSLLKTFVMMTGEFEYEGIFHDENNSLQFSTLTYFFFFGFLVIMSIIVVNLLIGLAVDDIKSVQEQAILTRLAMQVELVLDVERLLPNIFLRRFAKQKETLKPKKQKLWDIFKDVVSRNSIFKDASGLQDSARGGPTQVSDAIDSLNENMKLLKSELKALAEENRENRKYLEALAEQSGVKMDDRDYVSE